MVKIKVLLYNNSCLFHWCQHLEAIITDKATGRSFNINFATFALLADESTNKKRSLNTKQNACCVRTISLYSDKNYDDFLLSYYHAYGNVKSYKYGFNNCSDAVKFALDYFFQENTLDTFYCVYQAACCLCCIGTVGLKCFPTPPRINSPNDVFKRAQLLSYSSNNQPQTYEHQYVSEETEAKVIIEEKCNQPIRISGDKTPLSFAILNQHNKVISHLLDHHLHQFSPNQLGHALMTAIACNDKNSIEKLCETKIDFKYENEKKDSCLTQSIVLSKDEITTFFIEKYAEQFTLKQIHLAYLYLASQNKYELANQLLKKGIPQEDEKTKNNDEMVINIISNNQETYTSEQRGFALFEFIRTKQHSHAKLLLQKNKKIDKSWHTKVNNHYAIHLIAQDEKADVELIHLLTTSKPAPDLKFENSFKENPLDIAIRMNNTGAVRYFVEKHPKKFKEDKLKNGKHYLKKMDEKIELATLSEIKSVNK